MKTWMSWVARALVLPLGLAVAPACGLAELEESVVTAAEGAADHEDHVEESPDAEACEHLAEGPSLAVQAVSTVTDSALADVGAPHTRYDVDLTDVTDGQGGWVRLPVAAAGDYIVFLADAVAVAAFAADGATAIAAEDVADHSDECATVAGRYVFEFPVGETMLWFGPATTSAVAIVIEAAAEDHDHEHTD